MYYAITWYLIGFGCNTITQSSTTRPTAAVLCHETETRERQFVHGTPVQLLRAQTEAVTYKTTLARPSARISRYGIGGGTMRWMCEPSSGVIDEPLVLLLL